MREMSYTLDDLIKAVRETAAERPDYVYQRQSYNNHQSVCVYTEPDGTPSCLIGCGLAKVGDPVPAWDEELRYDSAVDLELAIFGSGAWLRYYGISDWFSEDKLVRDKISWLGTVQNQQDCRATWAEAVETADRQYPQI